MDAINLLVGDSAGIYVPQRFVENYDTSLWSNIDPEDVATIEQGPDHEWYWEAWSNILDNATYQHDGRTYHLYQDGDLYAIDQEGMTDEEYESFFGESRS